MDFTLMIDSLPKLLNASGMTLLLVSMDLCLGIIFAVAVALCRVSKNPLLRKPAYVFIFFVRGTPLLVQIFLIYYGLSQFEWIRESFLWPVLREPFWCALIAFWMNGAGYIGELFRGAIEAVPKGQIEAGLAMGMTRFTLYRRIILPQAIRIALPAYSNEIVYTIKDSSLASTITLLELTGMARNMVARTYKPVEIFMVAACIYLIMVFVATRLAKYVERRLSNASR
nr:ABC transporter permease [uncultured Desulfobacter sp.]